MNNFQTLFLIFGNIDHYLASIENYTTILITINPADQSVNLYRLLPFVFSIFIRMDYSSVSDNILQECCAALAFSLEQVWALFLML